MLGNMDESVSPVLEDLAESIARRIENFSLLNAHKPVEGGTSALPEPSGAGEDIRACPSQRTQRGLPHLSDNFSRSPHSKAYPSVKQEGSVTLDLMSEEKEQVEMDSSVWSELPEHLIDNILACLPVPSFLRLRAVCKKWNALMYNPSFLVTCSGDPTRAPLFLMYADHVRQRYAAYDPASNAWYLLPQSCFLSGNSLSSFVVLAAAGGLLCLGETSGPHGRNLYVSNPMTRARKGLPPMLWMPNPYIVGMITDSVKKNYKILVAQEGEHLKLQVYDSTSNSWKMTDSLQRRIALVVGTAYIQGILYCLTFGPGIGFSAYHVEQGTWQDMRAAMPPALAWPQLFVSRERLMLVGGAEEYGIIKNIYVWELDAIHMEWVEVLRMPDDLLRELTGGPRGGHYLFVADGDHICFTYYRGKEMLMCNLSKKVWWWLPRCTLEEYFDARSVLGFSLQPRLDAAV